MPNDKHFSDEEIDALLKGLMPPHGVLREVIKQLRQQRDERTTLAAIKKFVTGCTLLRDNEETPNWGTPHNKAIALVLMQLDDPQETGEMLHEIGTAPSPDVARLVEWVERVVEWAESRKFIIGMETVAETGREALECSQPNADFIAHSRSDIPALLSVIAQLLQQRDEAVAKCERIATGKDFYVRKTADLKRCIESHECNPSPLLTAPERTTR